VGVLDRGKLATSRVTERDRIDPNVWSGDRLAPTDGTMPLLQHMKASEHLKEQVPPSVNLTSIFKF
jgi:hypothetical protein